MIDNPKYKGEWKPKRISNPEYKGVWEPKKIDNPKYVADDKLYLYKDFGFIGFDLWQVGRFGFLAVFHWNSITSIHNINNVSSYIK